MKNRVSGIGLFATMAIVTIAWGQAPGFLPGQRVLLDAHNCYPYAGRWADRVDRALSAGAPLAIENDLIWDTTRPAAPRLVVSHGGKAKGDELSLREYFFDKVRPVVEKALKEDGQSQWPLFTLIRFYTLNGHSSADTALRGWTSSYNFGSLAAVTIRWRAARDAGVDFVASDQYEECAKTLRGK